LLVIGGFLRLTQLTSLHHTYDCFVNKKERIADCYIKLNTIIQNGERNGRRAPKRKHWMQITKCLLHASTKIPWQAIACHGILNP